MPETVVAIVDDADLTPLEKLAAALDRADFWATLHLIAGERGPECCVVVIKPELAGFPVGSPSVTDPTLVEALIDLLHDHHFPNVAIVGAADSSALWAENRDVYALSDLLGYRFVTASGR